MLTQLQTLNLVLTAAKRRPRYIIRKLTGLNLTYKEMGLIKTVVTFGIGVYIGIYASQNYEVPKVGNPREVVTELSTKINEFLEANKKDK